jgi:hypothetical protein
MVREWTHENEEMTWKYTVVKGNRQMELHRAFAYRVRSGPSLGIRSFRLPLLTTIILFSITVIALLCQQLWAWYIQIVSPCPEWVDRMWTSVGGGDDGDRRRWSSQDDTGGNVNGA